MIDDLSQLPDASTIECDVCIVGSGAAGLALATELLDSGRRVVVLESGAVPHEPATQDLSRCDIHGLPFRGAMEGRFRVFGGSTTRWGGQALPLTPADFEPRNWVPHSGWPLRFDDLRPYYPRASAFMRTDALNFDTDLFARLRFTPPSLDPALARYHFSKWSPSPNLREVYGEQLRSSPDTRVIFHANLTRLTLADDHGRVAEAQARSLDSRAVTVRARHFILATGGIEIARILLANNHQQKQGLGNEHDLVGRFFQDHPFTVLGTVTTTNPDALQHAFNTFFAGGLKYTPRVTLSPDAQKSHRILNASALFNFDVSPASAFARLKESFGQLRHGGGRSTILRDAAYGVAHLPSLVRPAWAYAVRRRVWSPDATIRLAMLTEQEPCRDSRVTLSNETDALGMPRAAIDWRPTDLTRRTMATYAGLLAGEVERLGLGRIELEPWVRGEGDWRSHISDSLHHIGTARMSDSPREGVVDRDSRVHGVENLWIASSAVFPTSGHSNPTLTILALAMRLADEIKRRLGASSH